jgi:hypothetical protein
MWLLPDGVAVPRAYIDTGVGVVEISGREVWGNEVLGRIFGPPVICGLGLVTLAIATTSIWSTIGPYNTCIRR